MDISNKKSLVSKDGNKGPGHIHTKKAAAAFPEPGIEDMDTEKRLKHIEGLSDESDIMWLSSDSKSSSFVSSDDSQDVRELDCWDLSLHDRFSYMLSLSGNCDVPLDKSRGVAEDDGFKTFPIKKLSVVFEGMKKTDNLGGFGEEGMMLLQNLAWIETKESPLGSSESGDSPYERSLCEDSLVVGSSCTSLSTLDDQSSHIRDFDRTDIWVSSLDLEAEDTKWVEERQGFDIFDSDFPSPSFSAGKHLQTEPPNSNSGPLGDKSESCTNLKGSESDEPIFWPFDYSSYWHPGLDKFLCASPRKDERNVNVSGVDGSKPLRLRLQKRNSHLGRKIMQEGCGKKLTVSSTLVPTAAEGKPITMGNVVPKVGPVPSRLRRSTRASSEENQSKVSENRRPHLLKANGQKHSADRKPLAKPLPVLEACEVEEFVAGVSVEKLVGLNEFDGHEGIAKEFNEEQFSLIGSPRKNVKVNSVTEFEESLIRTSDRGACNGVSTGSCQR